MARPRSRVRPPGAPGDAGGGEGRGGAAEGRGVRAELSGREVKRRLAGASQVERRSERPPSEDAEAGHGAPYWGYATAARDAEAEMFLGTSLGGDTPASGKDNARNVSRYGPWQRVGGPQARRGGRRGGETLLEVV